MVWPRVSSSSSRLSEEGVDVTPAVGPKEGVERIEAKIGEEEVEARCRDPSTFK